MQAFSNQQRPDIHALFYQFMAQFSPEQLEQLTRKSNGFQLEQLTRKSDGFPDIRTESRTHVPTDVAARWMLKRPQTLRGWACYSGTGPLVPIRILGKLAWPVAGIRKVLGVDA